jgi:hypothetical protein
MIDTTTTQEHTHMTTKTVTFKGQLGVRELKTYSDPHPGKAASDRVAVPCGRCVNESGYIRAFSHVHNGICFECNGTGKGSITVATLRKHAKAAAYNTEYAEEIQAAREAQREAFRAAAEIEAAAAAKAAAEAEEARLASLVQGFVGNEGDKIENLPVTINVAKYIEGSWNRSSSMFIIATTDAGQVVKIFGSSATLFGLQRGQAAVITTAKVKKHDWHNGQDQTVLGFVKMAVAEEAVA